MAWTMGIRPSVAQSYTSYSITAVAPRFFNVSLNSVRVYYYFVHLVSKSKAIPVTGREGL
jgi:hypothetical protein